MRRFFQLCLLGCFGFITACQAESSGINGKVASDPAIDPAFQSACEQQITGKMIDPTAAKITYSNMTTEDGIKASVSLSSQTDGSITELEFLCIPDGDGRAIAELLSD